MTTVNLAGQLTTLPDQPDVRLLDEEVRRVAANSRCRIVVLDDDPTGVQTVHDSDIQTTWQADDLAAALVRAEPLFYVLTNSRACARAQAVALAAEVTRQLVEAPDRCGVTPEPIAVVTRRRAATTHLRWSLWHCCTARRDRTAT